MSAMARLIVIKHRLDTVLGEPTTIEVFKTYIIKKISCCCKLF